ncbi:hypothetical protein F2P81_012104 [Scophthalmus maximus]|uniref:Uncharacterized protein n=1 Tax=Scophthalmus maximus TaxID=52904 RepID=A0A6A4T3P8_SCOMX|nr:hypothetical protein F2P81_012104 [Scophthalmus maximus]
MSEDLDRSTCRWFSIQCDESVDTSRTFVRMVFNDFSTKEELLTLPPLKSPPRGVDNYDSVKGYFVEKKLQLEGQCALHQRR